MTSDELEPLRKIESVEMALDSALQDLHKEASSYFTEEDDEDTLMFVAALIRAAYGRGLAEGIFNPVETIKMVKALGFKIGQ